jgi:hypothetical protein
MISSVLRILSAGVERRLTAEDAEFAEERQNSGGQGCPADNFPFLGSQRPHKEDCPHLWIFFTFFATFAVKGFLKLAGVERRLTAEDAEFAEARQNSGGQVVLLITFHFLIVQDRIKRIVHNYGFSLRSLRPLR